VDRAACGCVQAECWPWTVFDLQPAIATIEALRDRGDACAGTLPFGSIVLRRRRGSASRMACLARSHPRREVLRRISESQRGLRAIWCSWRVLQRALRLRAMPLGLKTRSSLAALQVRSTCINGIRGRCEELHPKVECANFHRAGRGSNSDLCRDSIFISF
jgi:hypothetical protein